jgi:hypothetical protein
VKLTITRLNYKGSSSVILSTKPIAYKLVVAFTNITTMPGVVVERDVIHPVRDALATGPVIPKVAVDNGCWVVVFPGLPVAVKVDVSQYAVAANAVFGNRVIQQRQVRGVGYTMPAGSPA